MRVAGARERQKFNRNFGQLRDANSVYRVCVLTCLLNRSTFNVKFIVMLLN